MQTIRTLNALRAATATWRKAGERIALVPTMGALHEGHLTLVREARRVADHVIVSIFVNPTQFGPNEDLDAYPRQEAADAALLVAEGVALLWAPDVAIMYPDGHATKVSVGGLDSHLCGAARPGHFDGVATVVAKLFNQVAPHVALFGEKDWQQLAIIRRMALDLDLGIDIVGLPTVREADGVAMSSRNRRLTPDQRRAAICVSQGLRAAERLLHDGAIDAASLVAATSAVVDGEPLARLEHVALVDPDTLDPVDEVHSTALLLIAAWFGEVRLIDNLLISPR